MSDNGEEPVMRTFVDIADPVFERDGKWWHVDEVWCDEFGPFDTEAGACEHLQAYCNWLNAGRPDSGPP